MRLWMGKEERQITAELDAAHGGREAQHRRVLDVLQVLPRDVQDELNGLIMDVFLEPKIAWTSEKRREALDRLDEITGGLPHTRKAMFEWSPIAKSARMCQWNPSGGPVA